MRKLILAAMILVLAGAGLSAVFSEFNNGILSIAGDAGDQFRIWCSDGVVYVNGFEVDHPHGGFVLCDQIQHIEIYAGPDSSRINLADFGGVNPNDFCQLSSIVISGNAGADVVIGSSIGTSCTGGGGNDNLSMGSGDDQVSGDGDDDLVFGNAGNDELFGGTGNDYLSGGAGNDYLNGEGGGNNVFMPGPGSDYIIGGNGTDTFHMNFGSGPSVADANILRDEWGEDTLDFSASPAGGALNLSLKSVAQTIDASGQTLELMSDIENYVGSPHDDHLTVRPLEAFGRTLDGGDHDSGDRLTVETLGFGYTDDGATITVTGYQPIHYLNWETVIIDETSALDSSWGALKQRY